MPWRRRYQGQQLQQRQDIQHTISPITIAAAISTGMTIPSLFKQKYIHIYCQKEYRALSSAFEYATSDIIYFTHSLQIPWQNNNRNSRQTNHSSNRNSRMDLLMVSGMYSISSPWNFSRFQEKNTPFLKIKRALKYSVNALKKF